jgi:hypothetical protein
MSGGEECRLTKTNVFLNGHPHLAAIKKVHFACRFHINSMDGALCQNVHRLRERTCFLNEAKPGSRASFLKCRRFADDSPTSQCTEAWAESAVQWY